MVRFNRFHLKPRSSSLGLCSAMLFSALVMSVVMFVVMSSSVYASTNTETYRSTHQMIEGNPELQKNLSEMGYESIDAATEALTKTPWYENLPLGTLAICAKGQIQIIRGVAYVYCTTLFNAYRVKLNLTGVSGDVSLSAEAIYFRTGNRSEGNFCFAGGSLAAGWGVYADANVMVETSCGGFKADKIPLKERGWLVMVGVGVGAAVDLSATWVEVEHLKSYW